LSRVQLPDVVIQSLLPGAIAIARQAGAAIMQVYGTHDGAITSKADHSPLTKADLASHRIICEQLTVLTPDLPVLTEESAEIPYAQRSAWQAYWLVDPLDGTKEFIKRNGEFTVNIALIKNGVPVLGVVYSPVPETCYYAANGAGAYVQRGTNTPHRISVKAPAAGEAIKVVASRSHGDARTEALLSRLRNCQTVSMGSSLKLCLVAEGVAHLYPRLGPTMEWDTAAAHAVVNEAGGLVCDSACNVLHYNKADLHNPEFFVLAKNDTTLMRAITLP
jgi:3'(2'), 5'-bisphosphate nucleotidase